MIEIKDIEKLATLSRMKISPEEVESLRSEIDSILGYVVDINKVSLVDVPDEETRRNVFRNDTDANISGEYTEKLLALSPDRDGNYIKVKKIL
ncbi:MAG: Asp-tRNA(Asn)/Glu-tRNA(Gln) amidotransferase subunit GatC [Candidatus Paceibacterota bacterium]|jgi:aspartyl-tRNA(Asn)/glutamyl-tRNA(Gln) amidotransferase subunit C